MLTISQRGIEMPASPIRKLVPYAEAAKQRGITVYHLNIGQPDIATPPSIMDAVKKMDMPVLEYSHSAGNESYRRKLVKYYEKQGIEVTHEQILITTGGSEAIMFAFFSCMNPGDEVVIPEPLYANYLGFACAAGVSVVPIKSTIDTGFALPPAEDFEKVITDKTKAILVCNPNNPTGYLYSRQEIEEIGEICKKHN
ncbi:MAG TPA: aminotransferase class I/II-fold pyridoxal phosphate-dependent enzyme, partial [Niabella sp.]|nr:aminotransferase class I/II-fold pyridoxal phosphate-dependent enzyme [Niabella sp.]